MIACFFRGSWAAPMVFLLPCRHMYTAYYCMGFGVCHESFKEHLDAGFYGFYASGLWLFGFPFDDEISELK